MKKLHLVFAILTGVTYGYHLSANPEDVLAVVLSITFGATLLGVILADFQQRVLKKTLPGGIRSFATRTMVACLLLAITTIATETAANTFHRNKLRKQADQIIGKLEDYSRVQGYYPDNLTEIGLTQELNTFIYSTNSDYSSYNLGFSSGRIYVYSGTTGDWLETDDESALFID